MGRLPAAHPGSYEHGGAPTGGGGGGGGHQHNLPARLDHEPTEAQKAAAMKLVADTRQAVARAGLTVEKIKGMHYISIGDELSGTTHYVKPEYHRDDLQLDPEHIEAFAARGGRLVAAMYVLKHGTTMDDVPDIAGRWTVWHDHVLPYRSNDFDSDDYFRLGGANIRRTTPMLHVWLEDNPCGPFAGTDAGNTTGSCVHEH